MATVWETFPHIGGRNDLRVPLPTLPRGPWLRNDLTRLAERTYIEQMRTYCLQRGSGPVRGEIIDVDYSRYGEERTAQYMVYSSYPLVLIWLHTPFENPAWCPRSKVERMKLQDIKLRVLNRAAKEVPA